ncbi:hypothetical protein CDIK_4120, partial [Cucumispora dikerogammari]
IVVGVCLYLFVPWPINTAKTYEISDNGPPCSGLVKNITQNTRYVPSLSVWSEHKSWETKSIEYLITVADKILETKSKRYDVISGMFDRFHNFNDMLIEHIKKNPKDRNNICRIIGGIIEKMPSCLFDKDRLFGKET